MLRITYLLNASIVKNLTFYPDSSIVSIIFMGYVMTQNATTHTSTRLIITASRYLYLARAFFAGLLIPFGFSPFHLPGITILGIALLFAELQRQTGKQALFTGFIFGLGFFGFGVSWVYVSIHVYGHLNAITSALITFLFVFYLALYPAVAAYLYTKLSVKRSLSISCLLFGACWCLSEYFRSTFMGGFPWLLLGFGQIDTPLKYLLPVIGIYGVSFLTCLAASFLVISTQATTKNRFTWLVAFVSLLLIPSALKYQQWSTINQKPVSVGIIQANLSMRDKWDEALFWQLLQKYKKGIDQLVGKKNLIVMPESAIPLPANYVSEFLDKVNKQATHTASSILLGIPQQSADEEGYFYNSIITLGAGKGDYLKQHLVPFGEFIPGSFEKLVNWLALPAANLKPGKKNQALIQINDHPIATLICYELAYPELLRQQMPLAEWIVSVSDDGWFGHSLAMYQQLQIAQVLSLLTGRYQVVSNNDGLSSIVDTEGNITASLTAFSSGILEANIYPATGVSPWVYWGDMPIICFSILLILLSNLPILIKSIAAKRKRRYPYQPN